MVIFLSNKINLNIFEHYKEKNISISKRQICKKRGFAFFKQILSLEIRIIIFPVLLSICRNCREPSVDFCHTIGSRFGVRSLFPTCRSS